VSTGIRAEKEVVLTRVLRHPPARVFAAWTRAEQIQRWLTAGPDTRITAQVDCREGGEFSFTFHEANGTVTRVGGRYLVMRPPERLVFTWTWLEPDAPAGALPLDAAGVETLVTVDFVPRTDGTLLTITHQRFKTDAEVSRHRAGWTFALDQLSSYLGAQPGEGR
jgi:uncharacterized protein YndB with AHSA1/START domain